MGNFNKIFDFSRNKKPTPRAKQGDSGLRDHENPSRWSYSVPIPGVARTTRIPSSRRNQSPVIPKLELLHNAQNKEPTANILLVPGFHDHYKETWTWRGDRTQIDPSLKVDSRSQHAEIEIFWPTDLLPQIFPNVRLFLTKFENASDTLDEGHETGPSQQRAVYDLISLFRTEVEENIDGDAPIIFIAHSFGGILVKALFNEISIAFEDDMITSRTSALIFLATPREYDDPQGLPIASSQKTRSENAIDSSSANPIRKADFLHISTQFENALNVPNVRIPRVVNFIETPSLSNEVLFLDIEDRPPVGWPTDQKVLNNAKRMREIEGELLSISKFSGSELCFSEMTDLISKFISNEDMLDVSAGSSKSMLDVSSTQSRPDLYLPTCFWNDDDKWRPPPIPTRTSLKDALSSPIQVENHKVSLADPRAHVLVRIPDLKNNNSALLSRLPKRNSRFCGREGLLTAMMKLVFGAQDFETPVHINIWGARGIGKTELTVEFCYRCIENNAPAATLVFWLEGYSRLALIQSLSVYHKSLFQVVDLMLDEFSKAIAVLDWLAHSPKEIILVIDDTSRGVIEFLESYLKDSQLLIIATSEHEISHPDSTSYQPFCIKPFTGAECYSFMILHGLDKERSTQLLEKLTGENERSPTFLAFLCNQHMSGWIEPEYSDLGHESYLLSAFNRHWESLIWPMKETLLILLELPFLRTGVPLEIAKLASKRLYWREAALRPFLNVRRKSDGTTILKISGLILDVLRHLVQVSVQESMPEIIFESEFCGLLLESAGKFEIASELALGLNGLIDQTKNTYLSRPEHIKPHVAMMTWISCYHEWLGDFMQARFWFESVITLLSSEVNIVGAFYVSDSGTLRYLYNRWGLRLILNVRIEEPFCMLRLASIENVLGNYEAAAINLCKVLSHPATDELFKIEGIRSRFESLVMRNYIFQGNYVDGIAALNKVDGFRMPETVGNSEKIQCLVYKAIGFCELGYRGTAEVLLTRILKLALDDNTSPPDFRLLSEIYEVCCRLQFDQGGYNGALKNAIDLCRHFMHLNCSGKYVYLKSKSLVGDILLKLGRISEAIDILHATIQEYRLLGLVNCKDARSCMLLHMNATMIQGSKVSSTILNKLNTGKHTEYCGENPISVRLANINSLRYENNGHIRNALVILEESVYDFRAYNPWKTLPGDVSRSLGRLYTITGQYEKAINVLLLSYQNLSKKYPELHIDLISTLRQLANTMIVAKSPDMVTRDMIYSQLSKFVKAEGDIKRESARTKGISSTHKLFLMEKTLCSFVLAIMEAGKSPGSPLKFDDICEKSDFEIHLDHPRLLELDLNHATILLETNDWKRAEDILMKVMEGCRSRYHPEHFFAAHVTSMIGYFHAKEGKLDKARASYSSASEILTTGCQWSFPEALSACNKLRCLISKDDSDFYLYDTMIADLSAPLSTRSRQSCLSLLVRSESGVKKMNSTDDTDNISERLGPILLPKNLLSSLRAACDSLKSLLTLTKDGFGVSCSLFWDFVNNNWGAKNVNMLDRILEYFVAYYRIPDKAFVSHSTELLEGTTLKGTSAVEALIWILSVLVAPRNGIPKSLTLVTPVFTTGEYFGGTFEQKQLRGWDGFKKITDHPPDRILYVEVSFDESAYIPPIEHNCWTGLFNSVRISDLSILYSSNLNRGLKIDFDILVQISCVQRYVSHEGGIILLGYQTALIPMEELEDSSILWHLVIKEDQVTRYIADDKEFEKRLLIDDPARFKGTAYLGWCENVFQALGVDPSLPIATKTQNLKQMGKSYSLSQITAQVGATSGVPPVQAGLNLQGIIQVTPVILRFTPRTQFDLSIDQSWLAKLIVYDEANKTAWLVSKLHLMLYAMRCYIQRRGYDRELRIDTSSSMTEKGMRDSINAEKQRWDTENAQGPSFLDIFWSLSQSVAEGTEATKRFRERDKIAAVELVDIIEGNPDAFAKSLEKSTSVATWSHLTKNRGVIVCSGIGEVLQIVDMQTTISQCYTIPTKLEVLVCAIKDLDSIADQCNRQDERVCGQQDHWSWTRSNNFFSGCGRNSCHGECWEERLQKISDEGSTAKFLGKLKISGRAKSPLAPRRLREIPESAGVCFGKYPKKSTNGAIPIARTIDARGEATTPALPVRAEVREDIISLRGLHESQGEPGNEIGRRVYEGDILTDLARL